MEYNLDSTSLFISIEFMWGFTLVGYYVLGISVYQKQHEAYKRATLQAY
jgi:hypothetical protein